MWLLPCGHSETKVSCDFVIYNKSQRVHRASGNKVAAFRGMHVLPVKHSYAWLPRKCDYRKDTQTDRQTDGQMDRQMPDKENLSRWWGEDRENPRDEPLSLDRALARSRREVHPEGFPILTSSWLIIYLAYFLPKPHFNQMFYVLQSIWPICRVGKCHLTSLSDVITTCVRTHSRTSNG